MIFPTTHPALARALAARGYDEPTAVQLAVLDTDAAGRDQLVSAQTGSGKTVAFGLALGSTLLGEQEQMPPTSAPLALIIAPTRELAVQVCRELTWLYESTGARVINCVGGMDARAEARLLAAGPHIVVGTPGRLRDHLERRRLDLSQLRAVVLDEADEMLDLGFREDLEFILDATPSERRTLLFSATVPRDIEALAKRYQRDAARIETVRRDQQHADIDYWAHRAVPNDVENMVVNVLRFHEARAGLVFCATREAVNRLNSRLLERGFSSVALSGELTQTERTRALQALRDGRARVLVATDVAARGLDLPDLALVIHSELPNDGETLLHRSGRTGRAGKKGLCVLIVPYNRRRKADAVIAAARLKVTWRPAPTPEDIRARDQERFLADASFTAPATEEEALLARSLQAAHGAEAIALALLRMQRAQLPAPEDLAVDNGPPIRSSFQPRDGQPRQGQPREGRERSDRFRKDRPHDDAAPNERRGFQSRRYDGPARPTADANAASPPDARPPRPRREDTRPMSWFRINIGRERNADPRWLLPLICRAGGVTKTEVGAIRIEERETRFQIIAEVADQFDYLARTTKKKEGHIVRLDSDGVGVSVCEAIDQIAPAAVPARVATEPHADRKPDRSGHKPPRIDRGKAGASGGDWHARGRPKPGKPGGASAAARHEERGPKQAPSKYAKKKKHRTTAPAGNSR